MCLFAGRRDSLFVNPFKKVTKAPCKFHLLQGACSSPVVCSAPLFLPCSLQGYRLRCLCPDAMQHGRSVLHRIRDTHTILADQWRHECDANILIIARDPSSDLSHMAVVLVDRFHETDRIGRMEHKLTDLILMRRRTDLGFARDRHIKYASRLQPTCGAPSRRMAAGSVSLVAALRDARNPSRRAPQVGHARLRITCALLMTM